MKQTKTFISFNSKKLFFFIFILAIAFSFGLFYFYILKDLPNPSRLKNYQMIPLTTHIYDRNGRLLYEIFREQNRTLVKIQEVPKFLVNATIAIEDKDFFRHYGISPVGGILRALKDSLKTKRLQGGSTITQQLVKSSLLTPERTVTRKIKEIILALWTERIFSKEEILELYLNQVPYGGSAYGVEQAAKRYFNKKAKDLSLVEAALLAGLPQAPSRYSPFTNPNLAIKRRNEVLKAMLEEKYISIDDYKKSIIEPLRIATLTAKIRAPHFVFYVKDILEEKYGIKKIEEGGLKVYTTLDLDIQLEAEKILKEELEAIKKLNVENGAILVTRPPTGEILAMVGSVNYFATPSGAFNFTTSALRQPGSAIKPLNYAVGLERKLVTASTVFLDVPTCFIYAGQSKPYCPQNYDNQFHGPVQLRFALGNSYNIPAVKMLAINGLENFIASASAFGLNTFKEPQRYGLSLTLGGGEVRMIEFAEAFSVFPNQGILKKLTPILKIVDKNGQVIEEFEDPNFIADIKKPLTYPNYLRIQGKRLISTGTSFIISHILLDNNARSAAFGSNSLLVIPKKAVSVKTGTTNEKRDNWTIGYTPNFLAAVWVGNNNYQPMHPHLTSGVTGAAPIWNRVMTYILKDQPDLWPLKPEDVIGKQVCWDTGGLASLDQSSNSCTARFEYFLKDTEPQHLVLEKTIVPVTSDDKLAPANWPEVNFKEKIIIRDKFSIYCLDCNNQGLIPINVRL